MDGNHTGIVRCGNRDRPAWVGIGAVAIALLTFLLSFCRVN